MFSLLTINTPNINWSRRRMISVRRGSVVTLARQKPFPWDAPAK